MSTSGVHGGMTSVGESRGGAAQRRTQRGILKFRLSKYFRLQGCALFMLNIRLLYPFIVRHRNFVKRYIYLDYVRFGILFYFWLDIA